jgi:transcriptional regulator with GAF, ATPase, and Fis domain
MGTATCPVAAPPDGAAEARLVVKTPAMDRLSSSNCSSLRHALAQAELVAPTASTVLLLGETGVGKELFAEAIHECSPRARRRMIKVSCAAIPQTLIESELFGRERGAYTGALARQIGRFEAADHSTLFLDEIGDLPLAVQVKLLRVLEQFVVERLGSDHSIKVDVRIVAATNRNLEQAVQDGTFRDDLFFRLNVFPIVVPPLRERVADLPQLAWDFARDFARSCGKRIEAIAPESLAHLQAYAWPGNVRELRNIIERAVVTATGPVMTVSLPEASPIRRGPSMTLRSVQIEHIRSILQSTRWRIRGAGGAADRLGLKPSTLETRMARLGISRPVAT